jgi:hypothetical protein
VVVRDEYLEFHVFPGFLEAIGFSKLGLIVRSALQETYH